MYLKSLTLRGFKSFASATTIELEPGITCIVGPNGSGKSNVVDALTWVMGEQGAKSLRGANMADVIFAGTSGRPALGRAQVELTIDNSDGRLPIDYSEVTIARTLFRGGGSEYTINGSPVRLLDVQELLSDTGMGKQMHVIVGQGQLDAVLRATPEERRGFIDEAAGVLKHRRRKERALRKLESMDANLVRVLDLTEEIRRQLRPLARQAKAAREASGVQERIDRAQRRLAADEYQETLSRLERQRSEVERLREQTHHSDEVLAGLREKLREYEAETTLHTKQLQVLTEMKHQFESVGERLRSTAAMAAERHQQSVGRGVHVTEGQLDLAREAAERAEIEVTAASETVDLKRRQYEQASVSRQEAQQVETVLGQRLREAEIKVERLRAETQKYRESAVAAESRVEAATRAVETARVAHADSIRRLEEEKGASADLSLAAGEPADVSSELAQRHGRCIAVEQEIRMRLEELQKQERDQRADVAGWEARRQILGQSLPPEGAPGEKEPGETAAGAWAPLTTVDQTLRVVPGWERAISALLSPFDAAPVVDTGDSLMTGWHLSSEEGEQFVALLTDSDQIQPDWEFELPEAADAELRPQVALATLSCRPETKDAVAALLAGAWVAADLDAAQALLRDNPAVATVGTSEGIVVTRNSVRGPGEQGLPSLLLRAQWDEANDELERAESALVATRIAAETSRAELKEAAAQTSEALTQLRKNDAEQAERAQAAARVLARIGAAEEQERRASEQLLSEEQRLEKTRREAEEIGAKAAAVPEVSADAILGEPRRELNEGAARTQKLREEEMEAQLALRSAEEQLRTATHNSATSRSYLNQLQETRTRELRREEQLTQLRKNLRKLQERAEDARTVAEAAVVRIGKVWETLTRQEASESAELESLKKQVADLQWQITHAGEAKQQAEVALVQAELQYQQAFDLACEVVADQVRDEIDRLENERAAAEGVEDATPAPEGKQGELDEERVLRDALDQLVAQFGPDQPEINEAGELVPYDRDATRQKLRKAQLELGRLGVVNPLAVQEHAALETRYNFLVEQVKDLKKSKGDLLDIITDVDQRVREAFSVAFEDTQREFARVFGILFPGGKGQLSLTDPDDPLNTGVEIYARPAGKRVTRLSLLSGGERSLAALAYLVAIFHARPSPFYVMDEVEAALDDVNLTRVLTVMEGLRASSQLILVTHQKRTMEIADSLYGVTMREGVTQVVSHRMGG